MNKEKNTLFGARDLPLFKELTTTVNCYDQVRVWISSDGLPPKHCARLIRLRVMNPLCHITLIVSRKHLTTRANESLNLFSFKLNIEILDISTIPPVDSDELLILEHIHAEINAFFSSNKEAKGNLSVVSDYLRLLDFILQRGLCADMVVEFVEPLSKLVTNVPCPLGVIARFKRNGCVSNDVTAGVAQSRPFQLARSNVAKLIRTYRESVCHYFEDQGIEENIGVETVSWHPRFFELRNKQYDKKLTGTARFSLAGGPDNFSISLYQSGIFCGFECDVLRGREEGELTLDHVPHVLTGSTMNSALLCYKPFKFGSTTSLASVLQRKQLWPPCLPNIISHWDHSWIIDCCQWQYLTYKEKELLALFDGPKWDIGQAASIISLNRIVLCNRWLEPPSLIQKLMQPAAVGHITKTLKFDEMTAVDREFILNLETPNGTFRQKQEEKLNQVGLLKMVREFVDNGIIAVHGLFNNEILQQLRDAFEIEIAKKHSENALQQIAFNICVDDCELHILKLIRKIASSPYLRDIISYYLGGKSKFVSARGYRQWPCKPLRYRAWDYHQDMKTKGPFGEVKVMLILTDVPHDGQAMRFVAGSQSFHWDCKTQRQSKFTMDEALDFGRKGLFVCYGIAGTCFFFDTNGIHSGHRNLSVTRDVITLNFTRDSDNAFCMFHNPFLMQKLNEDDTHNESIGNIEWRTSTVNSDDLAAIREEYRGTPSIKDIKPKWHGDVLQLVDVVIADLNVDLDLQLSPLFENDRSRDIGLVTIRDSPLHSVQYRDLIYHLKAFSNISYCVYDQDYTNSEQPLEFCRCLWQLEEPLASIIEIIDKTMNLLSNHLTGDASTYCGALLCDLKEAIVRCDSIQRLRTTTIFLYFATTWVNRLLVSSNLAGIEVGCLEILCFYVHIIALEDMKKGKY